MKVREVTEKKEWTKPTSAYKAAHSDFLKVTERIVSYPYHYLNFIIEYVACNEALISHGKMLYLSRL